MEQSENATDASPVLPALATSEAQGKKADEFQVGASLIQNPEDRRFHDAQCAGLSC
jgi:hypothetical protein